MNKKQEIIAAAFDLFCEKGYQLSMSELAGAVGIKTPSLYSHFSGKDEIVELMIHEEVRRYFYQLDEKMRHAERMRCADSMRSLYFFAMEYFSEYKRLRFWRTIPLISNEPLRDKCALLIAENDRMYNERMRQCFRKGVEKGELRPDASDGALDLYLAMIQGVLDGMLLFPKNGSENAFAASVFDAYWAGVRMPPEGRDSV